MSDPYDAAALARRSSLELRQIMALCAGLHADRHGAPETAIALYRVGHALVAHVRQEPERRAS